jgi:hypothetical protein
LSAGVCVGLCALLLARPAPAQVDPAAGLRPSFEEQARPGLRGLRMPRPAASRHTGRAAFGVPPGAGAGRTGYVSTNVPRTARAAKAASPKARDLGRRPAPRPQRPVTAIRPLPPEALAAAPQRGEQPAVVRRIPRPPEADPFDQVGIRAGSFLIRPAIEVTGGYDTNPGRVAGGSGSALLIVAPELQVRSLWEQHEVTSEIRGSYSAYKETSELDRPHLDAKVKGRIDVSGDQRVDLEGRFLLATDKPGNPDLPADLARLPIYTRTGASLGVGQRFNRLELALKGSVDRTVYENSVLTGGTVISNADRNYNQYGGALRVSYELTPGIKPFVEVETDIRLHDMPVDRFGERRDSTGVSAKAGTTFEITRMLTGDIAAGYLVRSYEDLALPKLQGLLLDGSLMWVASGLTTVKLSARTTADEAAIAGVSGVLRRDLALQIDHAFRRWLIGTVKVGHGIDDYVGFRFDRRFSAAAALTYKLSRALQIKGEARYERLRSSEPGADYEAAIGLVGMRWQP